ncbi:MAG: amidohydrolase family protein [Armatimonadota bacterium]
MGTSSRKNDAPAYSLMLRGGRVAQTDGTAGEPGRLDIAIGADGRIHRLDRALHTRGAEEWDLQGRLIMPGLVDVHQHLDKSRTARSIANPSGTLLGAIQGFEAFAQEASREDILRRAERTAEACLARGTVAIRSHVNVDPAWGLRGVEALVELRERLRHRLRLQVIVLVASSDARLSTAAGRELLEAALAAGADVVGGAPAFTADPLQFLEMLFEVAVRHDRPLDLHIDETLDPAARHLEQVTRLTERLGLAGRVVAGHCCSLGALARDEAQPIMDAVARAGVGIVTLPACNLFLQGRDASALPPRGLTRVADLLAAGVPVAYGSDNIQDPFNPVGSGDMLEVGRWTFLAGHLPVDALPRLVAMGSSVPASFMGLDAEYGIREGAYADLLIVDAEDPVEALMSGPLERTVLFHGQHVAGPRYARHLSASAEGRRREAPEGNGSI